MAAAVLKAKAIDKVFSEAPPSSVDVVETPAAWPEGENKHAHDKEEDLYGYETSEPSVKTKSHNRMPRRSSLKGPNACPRRASIGYTGEVQLTLPLGHTAKRRTSITFAENDSVADVDSVADLVDTPKRLWFQKEEYAHIQSKIQEIVQEAKKGNEDVDTRGLENLINEDGVLDRREAWDSVFDEQSNQKSRGAFNSNQIKDIYQFHSIEAQVRANELAAGDSQAVENYLKVTRKMCRRMSC